MALTGSKLATFTEGTSTSAVSPSVSPAANAVVFVSLTFQATSGTPTVTGVSGLGLSWALAKAVDGYDSTHVSSFEVWWAATGGSAPTPGTITVSLSSSDIFDGVVDQVTGLGVPLTLVGGTSSVGTSGSSTTAAAPSSPAPQSSASFL